MTASCPLRITSWCPLPGFGDLTVSDVKLGVGELRSLDLHFQPAGLKESVTVSAESESQLQTQTASIAGTVGEEAVNNLPINGRMISNLYLLAPGAQLSGSGSFGDVRFFGRSNEQNVIRYDGVQAGTIIDSNPADMTGANGASEFRLSQSLENIQEFHVESSTYSAEFGRGTGGQVTITTKSGSNDWHGDLFEYVRNDWFDARNYFDHGVKQAPLRLNQFGGSIGGAIIKDKLFVFASQENLLQRVYVTFRQSTLSDFARSQAVPAIRPVLAAFPAGQFPTADPLSGHCYRHALFLYQRILRQRPFRLPHQQPPFRVCALFAGSGRSTLAQRYQRKRHLQPHGSAERIGGSDERAETNAHQRFQVRLQLGEKPIH